MSVFILELFYTLVDIFQCLQSKGAILCKRFFIMQLLQLIERCDSKGSRRRLQKRLDLVLEPQIAAVETARAELYTG